MQHNKKIEEAAVLFRGSSVIDILAISVVDGVIAAISCRGSRGRRRGSPIYHKGVAAFIRNNLTMRQRQDDRSEI